MNIGSAVSRLRFPFHQEMMDSTEFIWGTFDTGFLSRWRMNRLNRPANDHEKVVAAAAA